MKLNRTDHLSHITNTLANLAKEAKAEESKIVGRHRANAKTPLAHHLHRFGVHAMHTGQLAWIGLPAILAFEAARPAWQRYVETPIADTLFGNHGSVHTTAQTVSTITAHFLG